MGHTFFDQTARYTKKIKDYAQPKLNVVTVEDNDEIALKSNNIYIGEDIETLKLTMEGDQLCEVVIKTADNGSIAITFPDGTVFADDKTPEIGNDEAWSFKFIGLYCSYVKYAETAEPSPYVDITTGDTIALKTGKIYSGIDILDLTLTMTEPQYCSVIVTTASSGDVTITLPEGLKFAGNEATEPEIGNDETWLLKFYGSNCFALKFE